MRKPSLKPLAGLECILFLLKTLEQEGIHRLHKVRERLIHQRTRLCNQIGGLLIEYGENGITDICREICSELYEELLELEKRIVFCDKKINIILT